MWKPVSGLNFPVANLYPLYEHAHNEHFQEIANVEAKFVDNEDEEEGEGDDEEE